VGKIVDDTAGVSAIRGLSVAASGSSGKVFASQLHVKGLKSENPARVALHPRAWLEWDERESRIGTLLKLASQQSLSFQLWWHVVQSVFSTFQY
jgi:hypothetical protein